MRSEHIFAIAFFMVVITVSGALPKDRVLSGGGIGATAGAVGMAIIGAPFAAGVVIGGAAGALVASFAEPERIALN